MQKQITLAFFKKFSFGLKIKLKISPFYKYKLQYLVLTNVQVKIRWKNVLTGPATHKPGDFNALDTRKKSISTRNSFQFDFSAKAAAAGPSRGALA